MRAPEHRGGTSHSALWDGWISIVALLPSIFITLDYTGAIGSEGDAAFLWGPLWGVVVLLPLLFFVLDAMQREQLSIWLRVGWTAALLATSGFIAPLYCWINMRKIEVI